MCVPKEAEMANNRINAAYGQANPAFTNLAAWQPYTDWQERQLRLECLKLVAPIDAETMVRDAQALYDFIVGKKP